MTGKCEWCGTPLRYAHTITHEKYRSLIVGVICVKSLTEEHDYLKAKNTEEAYKRRKRRLKQWLKSPKWYVTKNGNLYRKDDQVLIYKFSGLWKCKVMEIEGHKTYKDIETAKLAAFNGLEWVIEHS